MSDQPSLAPTPRSDAEAERYEKSQERTRNAAYPYMEVPADFARQLERENAELRNQLKAMLYIFDRGLPEGTVGRRRCDKAQAALTPTPKPPTE